MVLENISIHLIVFYAHMQKDGNTIIYKCKNFYTTTCGQFVVFYIYQKSRELMLEVILRKYFSTLNKLKNDLLVRDFVKLHYHLPWIRVAVEKPMAGPGGAKEVGKRRRLW